MAPNRGHLMSALSEIRRAYRFHSPELNSFCDQLEGIARQNNTRWFPKTNNAHHAAIAGLAEVATQLFKLREEAMSKYPAELTQQAERKMDKSTKAQLNAYLVRKTIELQAKISSSLTA